MPPARFETDIDYKFYQKEKNNIHFIVATSYTLKQNLVNVNEDYVPTPDAYLLLNTDLIAEWNIARQLVKFNIGIHNLLNKNYRDYLNRNRYFANELGRTISVRCSIPILISSKQ